MSRLPGESRLHPRSPRRGFGALAVFWRAAPWRLPRVANNTCHLRNLRLRRGAGAAALAWALLSLCGCFSARKDQRRYYSLPPMPTPAKSASTAPKGTLMVAQFSASTVHDRVGMVMRRSDVELRYSARHLWVKRPQHLVRERVAESLLRAGVVNRVVRDLGTHTPDWVLRGRVLAMEVLTGPDGNGPWRVRVALRMTLRSANQGEVLWRGTWNQTASVSSPEADDAARTIGQLLHRGLKTLLKPLKSSLLKARVSGAR